MTRKTTFEDLLKVTAALFASGVVLAGSCSTDSFQALSVGIDAAAGYLNDQESPDDDISFGDWLLDELED